MVIYGTRAGPCQPVDKQCGCCYKGSTVYIHILKDYPGTTFTLPPLGDLRFKKIYEVNSGREPHWISQQSLTIEDIVRTTSPADSIIAVQCDRDVDSAWKK